MNHWAKLKDILAAKSPVLSRSEKAYFVLLTGFFVFLFLLFFQPFGVNNYNTQESLTPCLVALPPILSDQPDSPATNPRKPQ